MDELLAHGCPTEVDAHSESSPTKRYRLVKSEEDDDSQSIKSKSNTNDHEFVSTGDNNVVQFNRRPRGLNNLGNTCYFNSVLQCLAKTPFLTQVLFNTTMSGEPITFHVDDENIIVQLEKCSLITENLYTTLQEINKSSEPSFTPNALLDIFKKKCKIFNGYRQHDSHECLRHLLTLIREDDLKRYQRSIIHHYGLSMRTSGSKIDENKTAKFKQFKNILQDIVLCPDQVFKGQLSSVVQCQTCNNKSEMTESFWDLSLPVVSNNEVHPLFANENNCQEHESTIQQQKQKKNEHKMLNIQDTPIESNEKNLEDENTSEDNLESKCILTKQPLNGLSSLNSSKCITIMKSNSLLSNSDHQMVVDKILDSDISADSYFNSSMCSGPDGSFQNLMLVHINPNNTDSGTSANTSLECDIRLLNVNYDNILEFTNDSNMEDVNNFQECLNATLKPQQKCEDDKYSILNCLNKFTAPEVMTDNNKVACQFCTTLHNMENNTDQQIFTNSVRQTLISSPPATLVLQLKRFQMCASTIEKITRSVSFPWILDIAPYCSVKCQDKLSPGQNQLLYSLYGVVVHEGEMDCGHYIAYIKVKDSIKNDDYRISFLEGSKMKPPNFIDSNDELRHSALSGTWYFVSDSMVREVTPDVVQSCQAYLMFYEQIL